MRAHILVHADFEAPGYVEQWILEKGFQLNRTLIYNNEALPDVGDFDFLVIMGGPMSAYDDEQYPWMPKEKELLRQAIWAKKKVLGICLGAQLLASSLGARVYPNQHKEIGWWPVRKVKSDVKTIFDSYPDEAVVLEWHGDTFDIPDGAVWIATSDAAKHQAFVYGDHVLALQFHPEANPESLAMLVDEERTGFKTSCYVQELDEIAAETRYFELGRTILYNLLDDLVLKG